MEMIPPPTSVIIPAWNAVATITQALDSIAGQGVAGLDVIVVDDGSTDETGRIAAEHPLKPRVVRRENGGPAAARNLGLDHAAGTWITFLDADDLWPSGSLELRMKTLAGDPEAKFVVGRTQFEKHDERSAPPAPWTSPNLGSGLYRREIFEEIGRFEESLRYAEDVDWFWRVREAELPCVVLEDVTLIYRRYGDGITSGKSWAEMGLHEVIRRSLLRRRQSGRAVETPLFDPSADAGRKSP
jgi:glycosyltransferase involved in cell wall biosynthesis